MKTNTLLLIGGAVVIGYLYAQRKATAAAATTQAIAAQSPLTAVTAAQPEHDVEVIVPGWGWSGPAWGAGSWGGFRGGRGGGHGGGGHHGGGHGHGGHH
jgi:hypothetical protein